MTTLAFYGTLRDADVLRLVLGRDPAQLQTCFWQGYAVYWAAGESFPMAVPEPGAQCSVLLFPDPTEAELARLAFYEASFAYDLVAAEVTDAQGQRQPVQVFLPRAGAWQKGAPWSLADWQAVWGPMTRLAAAEVMGYFGRLSPDEIAQRFEQIRARAQSRVRAAAQDLPAHPVPTHLPPVAARIEALALSRPYVGHFAVEDHDLRVPEYGGGQSVPVRRSLFAMPEAVTVLPYDPLRDRVLLIEQFRVGPYARHDPQPWLLEPIAGRIDIGEAPEQTARREAREEAGLEIDTLAFIGGHYPSPGAVMEYLYSYIGLCSLPDSGPTLAGLESEAEDIRAHRFTFDAVLAMAETGVLRATPLLLSVYWLARHRDRLRAEAR